MEAYQRQFGLFNLSVISFYELERGAETSPRKNQAWQRFVTLCHMMELDQATASVAARMYRDLAPACAGDQGAAEAGDGAQRGHGSDHAPCGGALPGGTDRDDDCQRGGVASELHDAVVPSPYRHGLVGLCDSVARRRRATAVVDDG